MCIPLSKISITEKEHMVSVNSWLAVLSHSLMILGPNDVFEPKDGRSS